VSGSIGNDAEKVKRMASHGSSVRGQGRGKKGVYFPRAGHLRYPEESRIHGDAGGGAYGGHADSKTLGRGPQLEKELLCEQIRREREICFGTSLRAGLGVLAEGTLVKDVTS